MRADRAIEMKNELWIKQFSSYLQDALGVGGLIMDLTDDQVHQWTEQELAKISLAQFVQKIDNDVEE